MDASRWLTRQMSGEDEVVRTHSTLDRRAGAVGAKCQFAVSQRVAVDLTAVWLLRPCSQQTVNATQSPSKDCVSTEQTETSALTGDTCSQ